MTRCCRSKGRYCTCTSRTQAGKQPSTRTAPAVDNNDGARHTLGDRMTYPQLSRPEEEPPGEAPHMSQELRVQGLQMTEFEVRVQGLGFRRAPVLMAQGERWHTAPRSRC